MKHLEKRIIFLSSLFWKLRCILLNYSHKESKKKCYSINEINHFCTKKLSFSKKKMKKNEKKQLQKTETSLYLQSIFSAKKQ